MEATILSSYFKAGAVGIEPTTCGFGDRRYSSFDQHLLRFLNFNNPANWRLLLSAFSPSGIKTSIKLAFGRIN